MKIDWSKVPQGTPVKHVGGHGILFSRVGHRGRVYFKNIAGIETWYGEENVRLADPADIAKYSVKDDAEAMVARCVTRSRENQDHKRDAETTDRLMAESHAMLTTPTDIARAFLAGRVIQIRPHGADHTAWVTVDGKHNIDMDTYEYRAMGPEKEGVAYIASRHREVRTVEGNELVGEPTMFLMSDDAIRKAIAAGVYDEEVAARFNGLVKEDRIRVVVKGNEADKHIVTEDNEYRLLPPEPPKPQYRKFDPDKDDFVLSDFCEQQIHHGGEPMRTNAVIDSINRAGVMARVYDAKGCRPVLKLITWAALAGVVAQGERRTIRGKTMNHLASVVVLCEASDGHHRECGAFESAGCPENGPEDCTCIYTSGQCEQREGICKHRNPLSGFCTSMKVLQELGLGAK